MVGKRQAVRAFSSKKVPETLLEEVLSEATRAPSAGNRQAYKIVVAKDGKTKRRIAVSCADQEFIADAPYVFVFFALPSVSGMKYGRRGRTLFCIQDATIAAAYFQLSATAHGLATCWVGAFEDAPLKEACRAEVDWQPVAVIPFGYAGEEPGRSARKPKDQTVALI